MVRRPELSLCAKDFLHTVRVRGSSETSAPRGEAVHEPPFDGIDLIQKRHEMVPEG